jgi:hypothetical protein
MKNTLISFLTLLIFQISCTHSIESEQNLDSAFFYLLDSSNYTSIDFRELPIEEWDKMIVLTPYTNAKELRHNNKIKIPREIKDIGMQYRDDISLILFVQGKEVTDYFTCPCTIDFSKINQLKGHKFEDSNFMVEEKDYKTTSGEPLYILK